MVQSWFLDAVFRRRYKKVYNIETSLCFIIQDDQNNDILKCLSQILSKIQNRIASTKTTPPDREVEGFRTPIRLGYRECRE